jgi:hypothetical protein
MRYTTIFVVQFWELFRFPWLDLLLVLVLVSYGPWAAEDGRYAPTTKSNGFHTLGIAKTLSILSFIHVIIT